MKRRFLFLSGLILGIFAGAYLWPAPGKVSHIYFGEAPDRRTDIIAHGGGLGHAPPNTVLALGKALDMGADILEVDVQQTRDGVMILRHDDTLDRTTDMTGLIADHAWSELARANAGARTVIDARSFADLGITIPRLDDVLAAFPDARWVLEIKNDTESAANAMCLAIRGARAEARVLVGSFHDHAMQQFRSACPAVATSASSGEVRTFVIAARLGLSRFVDMQAVALQLPVSAEGLDLTHPRILDAAHTRGLRVQYWTVNETEEIQRLIEAGADGLITDYVDRASEIR